MNWINILHFYQPPTSSKEQIDEVVKSSYQPWVDFLNKYKKVKITVNFTGCLTQKLFSLNYKKLLKDFAKIAKRKQIEFLESAAFHPILPLLPEKEIIKQIKINNKINKLHFGKIYKPKGFFLPEMAVSDKVLKIIKKLGYKYIILDEISVKDSDKNKFNNNIKYKTKNNLEVIFRNRKISQTFVPETVINLLEKNNGWLNAPAWSQSVKSQQTGSTQRDGANALDPTIITATDGELYGHKYWNWYPDYSYLAKNKNITTLTASEYLKILKNTQVVSIRDSSWESTEKELKNKIPFALWNHPKNKIHKKLWQFANFVLELNYKNQKDPNHFASRLHLENGLVSCSFWWASSKNFKEMFSPIAWDPSMVEKGAQELLNSVRSLEKINSQDILFAEKLFSEIRNLVWEKHWNNK